MSARHDWNRLWELFEHGLALATPARAAWLASLAGDDAALTQELAALFAAHERDDTPLDRPLPAPPTAPAPTQLGPYRLLGELGRGGMGIVFLAERSDGVHDQRVAVKLVAGAAFDPRATERFARERRILARLAHPGIARMLDGGTTPEGQAWLAMDYVDGVAIDAYAASHGLGVEARVALLREVCDAIAYAHRNLVVHRDLKPANILVRADGSAAVLDFGVAKLLDAGDGDTTRTEIAATPSFAAPEQLRGEPVTTAADVYALGATLYRLLTGKPPVPMDESDWATLRARVATHVPDPPSHIASAPGRIDADLDRVVMKALAKSPDERYPDAQSFADDLGRWLAHRPVRARPPSRAYLAAKFVRRHRAGVAIAVAALALIAVLAVRLVVESRATRAALAASELERERSERTTAFLADLFRAADPTRRGGETPDVRDLLREGSARLDAAALDAPLRARLALALAEVHRNLGLYDDALALVATVRNTGGADATQPEAALLAAELHELRGEHQLAYDQLSAMRRAIHGNSAIASPDAIAARRADVPANTLDDRVALALGRSAHSLAQLDEAEALYREALAAREATRGANHPDTIAALLRLGSLEWSRGRFDAAEPYYRDVLARRRASLPPDHPELAQSLDAFGHVLHRQGRYADAAMQYDNALAIRRRALGPAHRDIADSLSNLGALRYDEGHAEAAVPLLVEALAMQRAVLPTGSPLIGKTLNNLGLAYQVLKRNDDARAAFVEALAINRRAFGESHPNVAGNLNNLGLVELEDGQPAAALPSFEQALAINEAAFGVEHANLGFALTNLGRAHAALGAPDAARAAFERARAIREAKLGPDHPALGETLYRLGEFECARGERENGVRHLAESVAIRELKLAADTKALADTRAELARCSSGG